MTVMSCLLGDRGNVEGKSHLMKIREGWRYQIGWIFGKVPRGRGHFHSKIYIADFGNFKQGFLSWNWYKIVISGFRICFFNNCIEKNQNKTHFEEGTSEFRLLSGHHTSSHICNHNQKICNIIFQKWGGKGGRPFGIFPKIHPIWNVCPSLRVMI